MKRTKYLTEKEYVNLTRAGRALADYWIEFLPKMTKKLHEEGKLLERLQAEGDRLLDLQIDLMQDGYPEDGAWEVVKEEIYSLPPET